MDFKKKYLKYKLKYKNLKKNGSSNHKITLIGGNNYKPIIKKTDDLLKEVINLLEYIQKESKSISDSINYNYLTKKGNELRERPSDEDKNLWNRFESLVVDEIYSIQIDLKNVIKLLEDMDETLKTDKPLWNRYIEEQLLDLPDKINKTLNYYKDTIETLHGPTFFNEKEKKKLREKEEEQRRWKDIQQRTGEYNRGERPII